MVVLVMTTHSTTLLKYSDYGRVKEVERNIVPFRESTPEEQRSRSMENLEAADAAGEVQLSVAQGAHPCLYPRWSVLQELDPSPHCSGFRLF